MRSLKKRSNKPELMDFDVRNFAEFKNCLQQLEIINILTFAYRPTKRWFQRIIKKNNSAAISILDAGSGGGDMLRRIYKWHKKINQNSGFGVKPDIKLTGVDLNCWSAATAKQLTPQDMNIEFITADIFSLPPQSRPNYIISSLFTHHLNDEELIKFLIWMDETAIDGWLINDLHRHFIAYYFIKFFTRIIPVNRLIRHDAPLSVARAFKLKDWKNLIDKSGIDQTKIKIKWFFPFRYVIEK
jgi:SAM-dependent methyltransferase